MSWDGQGCSAFRAEWARTGSKKVTRHTALTRIKSAIWKDLSQTFLVPAFLSGSQNVLPLNPRAAFLQTQSKKQKTDILSSVLLSDHITQQRRCALSHSISPAEAFHLLCDPMLKASTMGPGLSEDFLSLAEKEVCTPYFHALPTTEIYPVKEWF